MTGDVHSYGLGFQPEIDRSLPIAEQCAEAGRRLERESLASFLILDSLERGEDYVPDFLWLYHGGLGITARDVPSVVRNDIAYSAVLASSPTASGRFLLHVREAKGSELAIEDNRRYFVALLDLMKPDTSEWPVARVRVSTRPIENSNETYTHRELVLSSGPMMGLKDDGRELLSGYEAVRARKVGSLTTRQALDRLPRIELTRHGRNVILEGMIDPTAGSMAEAVKGAARVAAYRAILGKTASTPAAAEVA